MTEENASLESVLQSSEDEQKQEENQDEIQEEPEELDAITQEALAMGWNPDGKRDAETFVEWGKREAGYKEKFALLENQFNEKIKNVQESYKIHESLLKDRIDELQKQSLNLASEGDIEGAQAALKKAGELQAGASPAQESAATPQKSPEQIQWEIENEWCTNPNDSRTIVANSAFQHIISQWRSQGSEPPMANVLNYVDKQVAKHVKRETSVRNRGRDNQVMGKSGKAAPKKTINDLPPLAQKVFKAQKDAYKGDVDEFIKATGLGE
jgi:hypothetical protein